MMTIRNARNYDAPALAALCGDLGYPATRQQVVARLAAIEAQAASRVLVVENAEGAVVGWIHVAMQAHLLNDDVAEILGFVVAESARNQGFGAQLLHAAECWAHAHGAADVRVRSRVEREHAHRFYERAGYARSKTQHVFVKSLQPDRAGE